MKYRSSQKEMERPILGRELKNTGSISLFPNSSRRRRRLLPRVHVVKI
jgi:hypothetical protein